MIAKVAHLLNRLKKYRSVPEVPTKKDANK